MNKFKKVGLTALAGSLAAISAHAAEMSVNGASVLTYTNKGDSEVTGNPMGMKTNLSFTASGEVNGYTVSYMQTSADQFAGMSSARLSVDLGDMGTVAFDQGSGSGLKTIDDKTPTAAEEIWDNLDGGGASAKSVGGLVGAAGSSGVFNYVNTFAGFGVNAAARKGSGTSSKDGASSGAGGGAWDLAITNGSMIDGLNIGTGYGEADSGDFNGAGNKGVDIHMTAFFNYAVGPVSFGFQHSDISLGGVGKSDEIADAWGLAFNINENLSVSYGEREVEYDKASGTNITEDGDGFAVAYTMGSVKVTGNRNEVTNNGGVTTASDESTEIAVSFAF